MDDNSIKYEPILASCIPLFLLLSYMLRTEIELITTHCAIITILLIKVNCYRRVYITLRIFEL
jgi:hypothetical protein